MMTFLRNLLPFLNRRRATRFGRFSERTSALAHRVGPKRGGLLGLGTIASIAAPFIIKKLMARRQTRAAAPASAAY